MPERGDASVATFHGGDRPHGFGGMPRGGPAASSGSGLGMWREVEVGLLVLLCLGVYFTRLTTLTIRGEESRWAQVAYEMRQTGDLIVPRQQGQPFPDRPPLNSWAMILVSAVLGEWNLAAVRLPAVLATTATTLLVYWYTRQFLTRTAALAAGAAYATMAQVLQLGRLAESDALLTLCVSASLLVWHAGYMRRWPIAATWAAGYALAALAGLAKGPQGPVYFVGATWLYLMANRDWRTLLNVRHLVGWLAFALVLGSWQVPFLLTADWQDVKAVWSEGSAFGSRFHYSDLAAVAGHFFGYPLEVLGCMLPWSFMLAVFASRQCRATLGAARPYAGFLLIACLVAFPTCWLPADSRPRYFMSLYPCVAALVGLACQRSWEIGKAGWWQAVWKRFLGCNALAMLALAGLLAAAHVLPTEQLDLVRQGTAFTVAFVAVSCALAATAWWARGGIELARLRIGVLTVAAFAGLAFTGVAVNALVKTSNQTAAQVAALKQRLGLGARLVSFGQVHHVFAYYYHDPIEFHPWPKANSGDDSSAQVEYFCFDQSAVRPTKPLPFAWEPVAIVSCDRMLRSTPNDAVVIGRRISSQAVRQRAVGGRQ